MEKRKITKQIPHTCPVCKGCGEVDVEIAQHEAQPKYENTNVYACHVCGGSCLIWEIREEEEDVIPPLLQLPPSIFTPQIPNLNPHYQPIVIDDPKITWVSNTPPDKFKSYNSPAWNFNESIVLGNTCGCPKKGPHTIKCMSTWNPRPDDPGKNGNNCACSPWGQPHSDSCKAY